MCFLSADSVETAIEAVVSFHYFALFVFDKFSQLKADSQRLQNNKDLLLQDIAVWKLAVNGQVWLF